MTIILRFAMYILMQHDRVSIVYTIIHNVSIRIVFSN